MAGLNTGAPIVKVYHEKSMILPDVSRVLACLYEKDIKFETHTTSSYKSLLRLQASNHAPVPFYDGPTFLEESREICRYIAETYEHHGYPFLLGKDSLERASIEQWLHHEEHAFNPPSRSLFCHLAFPLDEEDDDIDLQKRKLEEVLEVYEQRLGDSEFLAGNKFTLADLVHLPNSYHITESDEFVYLYDSRKNVQRWWNAISTRDSWQNVLKDIKKREQQHEQEELEKQQWLREHPTTTRRRSRLDSRKHTSTKSQTILVPPPVGIISTYPMAPRAEKPHPTKISTGEAQVSSSLSTPFSHKSSAARSKHPSIFTTHQETPPASVQSTFGVPEKSPMRVQRTSNSFMPATSPTTSDKKPSRNDADKSSTTDVSLPSKGTEIDLPTKSKPSSFKEAPNNLHVLDFYKASSHTDETEPYIKSTPQRTTEMLDKIYETGVPSYSTNHAKTSPRSAKEDPEQLSASGFYKTDSTAKNTHSKDNESVPYTERTLQKSAETINGRSTDQRALYTSGKPHSTEAHQKLLAEQWHAATAGLSNLKGETDHLIPTQQVQPSTDVQQNSSPNSEQPNTRPLAQEPVIMDGQQVEGRPEMTTPARYTGPRRDVSSVLWQQAADVRGIAEEDDASSDPRGAVLPPYTLKHTEEANIVSADRRKYASVPKHVTDEAPQGIPFQTAYDDRHETTQEARETASAQRGTRAKDAHDTYEGIGTYHSASPRSQPPDAPGDDPPPPKQAAFEGPRRATAPHSGPQELIIQARESPTLRPTVPHDAQGSTEEEETVDASSYKSQLLDSHRADARPPKQFSDEGGYGAIAPLQTGYTDGPYNRKRDRETAVPKRMMAEDAHGAQQKKPPAEDPQTTTSPFKKRYSAAEGTAKQSKHAASRPRKMAAQEVQDNFEESKAGDFWSPREQPSDTWRAPSHLPSHEVNDARSMTAPSQKRYPDTGGTIKEVEDISSMPRQMAGEDAKETKNSESASSRAEPLDYQRTEDPSRKQEAIEDPRGATSPFEIRYADVQDTTKHPRDTAFKPSKKVVQDAHGTSEEAEARKSASFRAQPPDAWQSAITPSKQPADEDTLSLRRPSPTRYPRAEETRKQPRAAASIPTHIAAQDARDVLRKSNVADSTSSEEQHSDAQATISFPKQEVPDARGTTVPVQKRYSDTKGTTKKAKVTFEEAKNHDSAPLQVQPLDSQRADATEDPHRATSPLKKRHSDVEGTTKQSRGNAFKPRQNVDQDAEGTDGEPKAGDSAFTREQPSDTCQAANTPTEQVPTQDDPRLILPSEVISDEHTIKQPRRTASTRRQISPQDAADTFQDSKPADSVSSREQPLSAWQPAVTPPTQEIKDSHSTTSAFQKPSPYVEDSTRPAKPTYTPRTALPVSKQAKAEEDAQDKGIENRETISAPNTMVYRDAQDTYGERKTTGFTSRDTQSPIEVERPPSVYQEDPLVAQDVREQAQTLPAMRADGSTQKHRQAPVVPSTSEDKPTPQAPPRAKVHDGHSTEELFKRDSAHDHKEAPLLFGQEPTSQVQDATELLQEAPDGDMSSKSSTIDQWRRTSVPLQDVTSNSGDDVLGVSTIDQEPTPMSQQPIPSARGANEMIKRPVEQRMVPPAPARAQTTDVQKRRQDPVVPSSSEEKPTPQAPPGAKVHDGHSSEEPFKRDSVHDHKEAPLLFGQEPTSQVQDAAELLQEALDGDMSSKSSTIDQWRRTSVPLQDVTSNSGDDVLGVSTIDQEPTPKSQQPIPSARGANEMIKRPVEQRMVPSAPARTPKNDIQRAPPSFPGADRAEGAGKPVQMQAPAVDGRATSVPTRRATHETGDQEFVDTSDGQRSKAPEAKYDSAIHEYVPDASLSTHGDTVGDKTTFDASEAQGSETRPGSTETPVNDRPTSDDELVGRFLRDQGSQPPESTQTQTLVEAPRDSVSIQDVPRNALDTTKISKPTLTEGTTPATTLEAQLAKQKFAPSDKKSNHAAEPMSFVESRNGDISVSAADQNKTPQTIFRHQVRPPAPITREVPSSDTQHNTRKIEQVTLDNLPTDDSPMPFVPSHEQVSHAQQTIPSKKHTTPAPGARDSPASDSQPASAKVQEVVPDNYRTDGLTVPFASSEKQGPYVGSSTEPHEGPWPDAHDVLDDGDKIKSPSWRSPVLEYKPDSTPTDSYVHPTSGDVPRILLDQGAESTTEAQSTNPKDQPIPASIHHIPANALVNFKKPGPISPEQEAISSTPDQASHLDAESDSAMSEVLPAAKKFSPSDQDSVHAAQQPSPTEAKKEQTVVAAVEQTLPAIVGQKHTQDMRKAPASDSQNGRPDEVTLAEQRFTPKDQDTQSTSSAEPRNEDSKDPGTQHASGKFQKVAPEDHIVESIRNQGQASRVKPAFEPSKGPSCDARSVIYEDRMRAPSSQVHSSDSKPNSTQNLEPSARLLPNQVAQPHTESQAIPPFMGIYDSRSTQGVIEDTLGNGKSLEPSSMDQEATASALTPYTDLGSAPGEVAPARQRSLLKDQDSALSAQKSSSSEPTEAQSTVASHNQHKVSQTIFGRQDIAPTPTKMKDPSSTPDPHGAIVEESMAHTTGPALSTHGQHDQDSDHQAQPRASDGSREQERHVDQTIVQQRIFGHQVTEPSPGKRESSAEVLEVGPGDHRPSELIKPLISSRKQDSYTGYPNAHGAVADEKTPPPLVSPAHGLDAGLNSAPASDDVIPTSSDEPVTGPVHGHEKLPAAFQASLTPEAPHDSIYPKSATADAFGDVEPLEATSEVTPADQNTAPSEPLSVIESRKEESTVDEAEESEVSQPVIGQQDIRLPGISEPVIDDDRNKEPVSREEQVSHSQRASKPHERSPPDVHGAFVDKKKTPPSSQAKSSDAIPDLLPTNVDVDPTSGEQPTTRFLRDQGAQLIARTKSPPYSESNQVVPKSSQPPSADQEVLSPTVVPSSAPDSQLGTASDEIAPDEQKISLSAPDLPRTTQPRFSVEPTKEKTVIAASDQTNEAPIIIGQQGKIPATDKERTPFDLHASELAKPLNESQEQVSHDGSAYEQRKGPTPDVLGAVDEMPLPSRNSDTRPDSAPISGDARHTSGGWPATSSIHDSLAQLPAGPVEALGGPKIINNVHTDFLGKIESPRPPSTDKKLMTHMTSPAPAPDAPQDQDSIHSTQLSPSVVSRKNVPNADQTNVSQAGLREPTSSDTTRPSEKIQELSPDAYLTKSEKPLLPMKGMDPSHGQDSSTPQIIPGQEGMTPASGTRDSPPSDTQLASAKVQEVVPDNYTDELALPFVSSEKQDPYAGSSTELHKGPSPDAHGPVADKDITKSPSREATVLEARPGSTPTDSYVRPTSNDEPGILPDQRKESPTTVQATYPEDLSHSASTLDIPDNALDNFKKLGTISTKQEAILSTPGQASEFNAQPDPASKKFALSEPLSIAESRKEESAIAEPEESKVSQPVIAQQDIRHAPGISEPVLDDDGNKEPVEEQVSHGLRDSEPHEGSPPDVHDTFVIKKKTPPSSQAKSSDATPGSLTTSVDVDPSSGEQSTTRTSHDQGTQLPARIKSPLYSGSNQVVSKSLEAPSADQEVLSPTVVPASTQDSSLGTASDEIAPHEQNFSLSAQDLAHSAQPPFSVEPTKEETIVAASDQTNEAWTVVGRQGIRPSTDKEKTQLDLHASGSAKSLGGNQEQVPHAGNAYEQRKGPPPDVPGAVDQKISLSSSQAQNSKNRPDSAPMSADTHRTRGDGPATSSLRDSQEEPPAVTQALPEEASRGTEIIQSVPADFLEKIESPRPLSVHQEFMAPMANPSPVLGAPQDQDSIHSTKLSSSVVSRERVADADQTNVSQASSSLDAILPAEGSREQTSSDTTHPSGMDPVQSPYEASFDLSSDEKTTMIKGDQANTISNVSLLASQAVGQSESGAVKGASEELVSSSSQKNLEGTSNGEKSMEQQQTDQSSTRSSKDDGIQTSGTTRPNILTASGDVQPSPLKESMEATEESSNKQVDQAVFQSTQDSKKQLEENEAQDTGTDVPEETNFHQSMNLKNNGSSQRNALEQSGEQAPGVQLRSNNTNNGSKPTKDVPSSIQADDKSERNLRTSEESKQQMQTEDNTKGGETKVAASKTERPEEKDLPSSNKSITSQSQAETSKNLKEQASSNIQNRDTNSSKLDGSTDDMKSGNMEDKPSS